MRYSESEIVEDFLETWKPGDGNLGTDETLYLLFCPTVWPVDALGVGIPILPGQNNLSNVRPL